MFTGKGVIMGFNRGTKLGAENRKGHRWINNPNNAHRKCTKCGCMVDVTSSKGKSIPLPTVEEFTYKGTGKVVGYIDGGFFREDKFLIVDKETKKFIKVKVSDCEILEY